MRRMILIAILSAVPLWAQTEIDPGKYTLFVVRQKERNADALYGSLRNLNHNRALCYCILHMVVEGDSMYLPVEPSGTSIEARRVSVLQDIRALAEREVALCDSLLREWE